MSYVHFLNRTPNTSYRIPQYVDNEKRQVDKNILSGNSDFQLVILTMPNGDLYFDETYSRQQISTTTNLGFRDYFKRVTKAIDTYLKYVLLHTQARFTL